MNTPDKQCHDSMQEHGSNCCMKCGKPHRRYAKLAPFSLAMASGIVYALSILILGWLASKGHTQLEMGRVLGSNDFTNIAAGFVFGFVSALVFAWLYNACLCCAISRPKCCKCSNCGQHCCKC